MNFLIRFVTALAQVGRGIVFKPTIENGVTALESSFPYLVKLVNVQPTESTVECAGIALAERWVLTAAHCVEKRLFTHIRPANSSSLFSFSPQLRNGLALLFVTDGTLPQHWTNPILRVADIPSSSSFVALGWGGPRKNNTNPELRRSNLLSFEPTSICERLYAQTLQANELCVGRTAMSPCRHDSGGPLFTATGTDQNPVLGGLVGVVNKADTDCSNSGPALFSGFDDDDLSWIQSLV